MRRVLRRITTGRWATRGGEAITSNRRASSTAAGGAEGGVSSSSGLNVPFPVVQLPARSLWAPQRPLSLDALRRGEFHEMIEKVKATRSHYQYPSLSAPQIGWNVAMFTLFDGTVFINPEVVETNCEVPQEQNGVTDITADVPKGAGDGDDEGRCATPKRAPKDCWAWEPCASCAFLMHYIHRPSTCRIRAFNEHGQPFEVVLEKMRCRFALHEMDHLQGILFTRRIPDTNHVVLLDGFVTMSDWSDDYPSLEARSTFLYNSYTPPYYFEADSVTDANLLDRKFEDNVYPGCEMDRKLRIESTAYTELQRAQWRMVKEKSMGSAEAGRPEAEAHGAKPLREAEEETPLEDAEK